MFGSYGNIALCLLFFLCYDRFDGEMGLIVRLGLMLSLV